MINKADAADPLVLQRLRRREPHCVVVSARTGAGIDELLALIDARAAAARRRDRGAACRTTAATWCPALHDEGEVVSEEHTAEGTLLKARVTRSWRPSSRRTPAAPCRPER